MSICCGRAQSVCNLIARVKVISDGSDICKTQFENCEKAIEVLGMNIALDNIEEQTGINDFGVKEFPGIVIGSKVVSKGTLLSSDEVSSLIRKSILGI